MSFRQPKASYHIASLVYTKELIINYTSLYQGGNYKLYIVNFTLISGTVKENGYISAQDISWVACDDFSHLRVYSLDAVFVDAC